MRSFIKEYGIMTIGIILVALGNEYFFIPNNLAGGGITGIGIIINEFAPNISVGAITFILNAILLAISFIFINGDFGIKTIYASLGLSIMMWFIEKFCNPVAITSDLIIATIFGTIIAAFGMALVFNQNSSTGGTDILAKILNKFFNLDIGKSLLIVDFIITFAAALVFGIDIGLYSMLSVIILGILVDNFIEGFNICKQVIIISQKNDEISKYIMDVLGRGCTFLKGTGGFTGNDSTVLYAVLSRNQFIKLKRFIQEIDTKAFITVGEVHEVLGEGFKDIQMD
ncbi:membrane protein [Clostridium botulinum]|uniref:YitT family protein n=1 Tax=Clostridium botulinum TaxID=1491 RepID=UPI000174E705|nr:YitT family protein [Clostridium botulinum]ACD51540.1 putative membrane protein [Clostridium botulinum E3 str. Alaska E43]AJF30905.1 membrane protein [Clostridium botulinum]AJF33967.1 membrane protein [Clostridium botulinum]MBY6787863.1 YitT family protein [Clostridium botulinum]MBY6815504.1 YitT family protein [Clostridium botulinum]